MGRLRKTDGTVVSRRGFAGVLVFAILLSTSCEDVSLFTETLDDEVKLANDRYLEVVSVYPAQNSWFVNPGQDIQVTFDRGVDPLVALDHVVITDTVGNVFPLDEDDMEFDSGTNTLTMKPDPYLDDSRQYSIRLDNGMTGSDATSLRDEYSWSFTTGTYPKGYFVIHDEVNATGTNVGYTTSVTVPLEVTTSNATEYFIDDVDPAVSNDSERSGLSWNPLSGNVKSLSDTPSAGYGYTDLGDEIGFPFTFSASPEGPRKIYMMFRDDGATGITNYTPVEIGETFLDLTAPVADAGGNAGPVNSGITRTGTAADPGYSSGTGSGIDTSSYSWSAPGMTVKYPDSPTAVFTGAGSTDAVYTVTMTVSDLAGNTDSDSFTLDWDTEIPDTPTITSPSTTTDSTPVLTWDSSASGDAIASYRRRLNGGTTYTTGLDYYAISSRSPLSDGRHRIEVAQYDDAGNLSDFASQYFVVNSAEISPYDTQTGVARSGLSLDWPPTSAGLGTVTYGYVLYVPGIKAPIVIDSATGLSVSQSGSLPILTASTQYYWIHRATVTSKLGTTTYEYGPFTFTTGK